MMIQVWMSRQDSLNLSQREKSSVLLGQLRDFDRLRILLVRLARLGDVILLIPAIKALRKQFPRAHISVLVGHRCEPILKMCAAVDEIISVNRLALRDGSKLAAVRSIFRIAERIRRAKYDLVLDFQGFRETNLLVWYSQAHWRLGVKRVHGSYLPFCFNLDPVIEDKSQHMSSLFLSLLRPLGIASGVNDIFLDLSAEDIGSADAFLQTHQVGSNALLIGFHVGAGSPGRVWPKEKFAILAERLIDQHQVTVLLFSGPQDGDSSKHVADLIRVPRKLVASQLSLKSLAAIMSRCRILVSNDTGPMHLGPAVGVPTLGLFSLGYPENYRPLGDFSRFVRREPIETLEVNEVYSNLVNMIDEICKTSSLSEGPRDSVYFKR